MKIESLTLAQEVRMLQMREYWLKTGLSTKRADRPITEKTISEMYSLIGKKSPRFIWMDSPFGSMISIYLAKKCMNIGANLRANLRDNLRDNLRANLGDNVRDLYDSNYFWGSLESYWICYYKFANEIGVPYSQKDSEKLELWSKLALSCFWWWPYENVCFLSDRPKAIHRNSRGRLHNPNGLAIEFHDGYGMFCLNGIRMKALDVTIPAEKLDPKEVMKRENVDERRELIRKIGIERMLSVLKSRTIDTKNNYSLIEIELSPTIKNARYLKMKNPSIGIWHLEAVARECNTIQEALNWRAGDIKTLWEPVELT